MVVNKLCGFPKRMAIALNFDIIITILKNQMQLENKNSKSLLIKDNPYQTQNYSVNSFSPSLVAGTKILKFRNKMNR